MSNIKAQRLGNRMDLELERKGVVSARASERALEMLRRPGATPATAPPAIVSDVKSGAALADVLGTLHDAGVIDNQSTAGNDPIVPLSDSAKALDEIATTGIVVRTGPGSYVTRKLSALAGGAGFVVVNGDGVASGPMMGVSSVLSALAAITSSGVLVWDNTSALARVRVLTAGSGNIVITDGDGVAADPTIDISPNLSIASAVIGGGFRVGSGGTPTITTGTTDGPGAGAAATITARAGGDFHGEFTLNASGTTSAAQVAKVTFGGALGNANYDVLFMCRNANATKLGLFLNSRANGNFTIGAATAPVSGQAYNISYWVIGR